LEIETICPNIMTAPTLELRDKIKKLGIGLSDISYDLNQGNKMDILIGSLPVTRKREKEHVQLKRTQQMVNDQFLETQRLQVMDMRRMQSVLTSEQQRQISGAKKRDERKMELLKGK
ncbi:hypothetical protein CEXT_213931, partial [Caerostris extrusa]